MKNGWLILSFLFLIQPVLPVLEYAINYDYIVEVLCINKDNKTLHCAGKCHLGKEIAKEIGDLENSNNHKPTSNKVDIQLYWEDSFSYDYTFLTTDPTSEMIPYKDQFVHDPHIRLFSPPPQFI